MKYFSQVSILRYKAFFAFYCLLFAWLFFFWDNIVSIFKLRDPGWLSFTTYSILLIGLYFMVSRKAIIEKTLLISSQMGLVGLLMMTIVFVLGKVNHLFYVEQSSVILMFPAIFLTTLGPVLAQKLLFPLLYLMLIIPLQDESFEHRAWVSFAAMGILVGYVIYRKLKKFFITETLTHEFPVWAASQARWFVPTTIAFCLMMASPWLGENIRAFYPKEIPPIVLNAPLGFNGWTGPSAALDSNWQPRYSNASAVLEAQYTQDSDKTTVELYSAYFEANRSFSDVLASDNSLYNKAVWTLSSTDQETILLDKGTTVPVIAITLTAQNGLSRLVWYGYYVAGLSTVDLSLAGFLDKVRLISKDATGSGVMAFSTTYIGDSSVAKARLTAFLNVMYNRLEAIKQPDLFVRNYRNQSGKV